MDVLCQAEDGIRVSLAWLEYRRVLFRSCKVTGMDLPRQHSSTAVQRSPLSRDKQEKRLIKPSVLNRPGPQVQACLFNTRAPVTDCTKPSASLQRGESSIQGGGGGKGGGWKKRRGAGKGGVGGGS